MIIKINEYTMYGSKIDLNNEIDRFFQKFTLMFGERFIKPNMHEIIHIADNVYENGPCEENNMFYYESLNGKLKKFYSGSKKIHLQIAKRFVKCTNSIRDIKNNEIKKLSQEIMETNSGYQHKFSFGEYALFLGKKISTLGIFIFYIILDESMMEYKRCIYKETLIQTHEYTQKILRNNSVIKYSREFYSVKNIFASIVDNVLKLKVNKIETEDIEYNINGAKIISISEETTDVCLNEESEKLEILLKIDTNEDQYIIEYPGNYNQ